MVFTDKKAESRHRNAEYTKKFVEILYPHCEEKPEFYDLDEILP